MVGLGYRMTEGALRLYARHPRRSIFRRYSILLPIKFVIVVAEVSYDACPVESAKVQEVYFSDA